MAFNQDTGRRKRWQVTEDQILMPAELRKLSRIVTTTKNEASSMGRTTAVKDWFVVMLGLETGLRVQEMADLCCGDMNIQAGRSNVKVRFGKGGKARIVYARETFASKAKEYLQWKNDIGESTSHDAPVFSVNGRRLRKRALQRSYKRSLKRAEIQQRRYVGIHSLRHYAEFRIMPSRVGMAA